MSEISMNLILDGITLALRASHPNARIASDPILQGLRPPAFFVRLVSETQAAYPNQRWQRRPRFDVVYFPVRGREDCYAMADKLCQTLELITLPGGDKVRGTDMNFEVVDGVLHFLISYHHFVHQEKEQTEMEKFNFQQGGV